MLMLATGNGNDSNKTDTYQSTLRLYNDSEGIPKQHFTRDGLDDDGTVRAGTLIRALSSIGRFEAFPYTLLILAKTTNPLFGSRPLTSLKRTGRLSPKLKNQWPSLSPRRRLPRVMHAGTLRVSMATCRKIYPWVALRYRFCASEN